MLASLLPSTTLEGAIFCETFSQPVVCYQGRLGFLNVFSLSEGWIARGAFRMPSSLIILSKLFNSGNLVPTPILSRRCPSIIVVYIKSPLPLSYAPLCLQHTMDDPNAVPGFLLLPFDWYILVCVSRAISHLSNTNTLPIGEVAQFGSRGACRKRRATTETSRARHRVRRTGPRRPQGKSVGSGFESSNDLTCLCLQLYAQKAFSLRVGDLTPDKVPRPVAEVPQDLLTETERRLCNPQFPQNRLWIRTDYGEGTSERFQVLVQAFPDAIDFYMDVMQDHDRYAVLEQDLRTMFAFFPTLLDVDRPEYLDGILPFDSEKVQNELFLTNRADSIAEEDRESSQLSHFFITDVEAMRTGFIRWVVPDQYGSPLFSERVQPRSLMDLQGLITGGYRSLGEFRREVASGYYGDGPRYRSNGVVEPWEPPS